MTDENQAEPARDWMHWAGHGWWEYVDPVDIEVKYGEADTSLLRKVLEQVVPRQERTEGFDDRTVVSDDISEIRRWLDSGRYEKALLLIQPDLGFRQFDKDEAAYFRQAVHRAQEIHIEMGLQSPGDDPERAWKLDQIAAAVSALRTIHAIQDGVPAPNDVWLDSARKMALDALESSGVWFDDFATGGQSILDRLRIRWVRAAYGRSTSVRDHEALCWEIHDEHASGKPPDESEAPYAHGAAHSKWYRLSELGDAEGEFAETSLGLSVSTFYLIEEIEKILSWGESQWLNSANSSDRPLPNGIRPHLMEVGAVADELGRLATAIKQTRYV